MFAGQNEDILAATSVLLLGLASQRVVFYLGNLFGPLVLHILGCYSNAYAQLLLIAMRSYALNLNTRVLVPTEWEKDDSEEILN